MGPVDLDLRPSFSVLQAAGPASGAARGLTREMRKTAAKRLIALATHAPGADNSCGPGRPDRASSAGVR